MSLKKYINKMGESIGLLGISIVLVTFLSYVYIRFKRNKNRNNGEPL